MLEEMKFMCEIGIHPKPEIKVESNRPFKPELIYIKVPLCYFDIVEEDYFKKYLPKEEK